MIVIDMDMPEGCYSCPIGYDYIYCPITKSKLHGNNINPLKERLKNCPIVAEIAGDCKVPVATKAFFGDYTVEGKVGELFETKTIMHETIEAKKTPSQ